MKYRQLLALLSALVVFASLYALGSEMIPHAVSQFLHCSRNTSWVLEKVSAKAMNAESWRTSVERTGSFNLGDGMSLDFRVVRDSLTDDESLEVENTLELRLNGSTVNAGSWSGEFFRSVLEPEALPWVDSIEKAEWLPERKLLLAQVRLLDGGSWEDRSVVLGLDESMQPMFISLLDGETPSWTLNSKGNRLCTGRDAIDLDTWEVQPIEASNSEGQKLASGDLILD